MIITNLIVAFLFAYYTFYATDLFDDRKRKDIQQKNNELEKYRKIPIKTLEQQKEFLNVKTTPQKKFQWNMETVVDILYRVMLYFVFINIYLFVFKSIVFTWWQTILIVILVPLFVNVVLEKFRLQKSDITVFFRGGKNNNNRPKTGGPKTGK